MPSSYVFVVWYQALIARSDACLPFVEWHPALGKRCLYGSTAAQSRLSGSLSENIYIKYVLHNYSKQCGLRIFHSNKYRYVPERVASLLGNASHVLAVSRA